MPLENFKIMKCEVSEITWFSNELSLILDQFELAVERDDRDFFEVEWYNEPDLLYRPFIDEAFHLFNELSRVSGFPDITKKKEDTLARELYNCAVDRPEKIYDFGPKYSLCDISPLTNLNSLFEHFHLLGHKIALDYKFIKKFV